MTKKPLHIWHLRNTIRLREITYHTFCECRHTWPGVLPFCYTQTTSWRKDKKLL